MVSWGIIYKRSFVACSVMVLLISVKGDFNMYYVGTKYFNNNIFLSKCNMRRLAWLR